MGLFSFLGKGKNVSNEEKFWTWFQKNEDMLFHLEKDRERTFDKLSTELSKVGPDLTFEFGPICETGKREFVISAAGIKSSFPLVESLFDAAPDLEQWNIIKFRQRRTPLNDLSLNGLEIKAEDVYYNLYKDGDKLGIILFIDGYTEDQRNLYASAGYLFLDEALGEYDVETKLGFIEFHNKDSEYFNNARTIENLAAQFDEYFEAE